MNVGLSAEAAVDVNEIDDYDRARSGAQTASRFLDQLDSVLELIGMFPEGAQSLPESPGVRRVGVPRFPYYVFYEVIRDDVIVLRILHTASSSDDWP